MEPFCQYFKELVVVNGVEIVGDVALDKPPCSCPLVLDFCKGCVAPAGRSKAVGALTKLRFVLPFQDAPYYCLKQFIFPGWSTERASFAIGFGDVPPSYWRPSVSLVTHLVDELVDLRQ